nr:membrane dipeptidase [Kineobactrum salinum]
MDKFSRRTLLRFSAASAALSASGVGLARQAGETTGFDPAQGIVINYLGGIGNPNLRLQQEQQNNGSTRAVKSSHAYLDERALQDLQASGTSAVNITLGHVAGPAEPFEYTVREIAAWNRIIASYPQYLLKVRRSEDVLEAHKSGRTGVIFGFQNTTMLEEDAGRVEIFAGLG